MREFRFALLTIMIAAFLAGNVFAQYWFQFGARSGNSASFNNGARVEIQTITPQNLTSGSLGFWVGEILSNGAFIQAGYLIENATGNYPAICTESGCTNYEEIKAGDAEWFYEYFPPNSQSGFFGAIGPDGSAGANGTFHTYGFYSIGNTWYFTFDGKVIGNINLGTSTSGAQVPVAFGELANTSTTSTYIKDVIFANLSVYKYGLWLPVSSGYAYIGYGVGSEKNLRNPYGVKELGNRVDYFAVGSGLPQPLNGTQLWTLGYYLNIKSKYGSLNSTTGYIAYSSAEISAPQYIYISPETRAAFDGWLGYGLGAYTGPLNSTTINIDSNITEIANWKLEYFVNISSTYGSANGTGWYGNGSTVYYSISSPIIYKNSSTRYVFLGWSNGNKNTSGRIIVNGPVDIKAIWTEEFLVYAKTPYGNATGSGWYRNNTIIFLKVPKEIINQTPNERLAFYSWSNGNESPELTLLVNSPVNISAIYGEQYLVRLIGVNGNNEPVNVQLFSVDGEPTNGSVFLFANTTNKVDYVIYKGVKIISGVQISADSPKTIDIPLRVYDVAISTKDIFGLNINALARLSFSNGSTIDIYTNGSLVLKNVPYGYVNGTLSYLGISQHVLLDNGAGASLIFFSTFDIGIIAGVAIVIGIAYYAAREYERKKVKEASAANMDKSNKSSNG